MRACARPGLFGLRAHPPVRRRVGVPASQNFVDDTAQISPWYIDEVATAAEIAAVLKDKDTGFFRIRNSTTQPGSYILSFNNEGTTFGLALPLALPSRRFRFPAWAPHRHRPWRPRALASDTREVKLALGGTARMKTWEKTLRTPNPSLPFPSLPFPQAR